MPSRAVGPVAPAIIQFAFSSLGMVALQKLGRRRIRFNLGGTVGEFPVRRWLPLLRPGAASIHLRNLCLESSIPMVFRNCLGTPPQPPVKLFPYRTLFLVDH